MWRGLGSWGTPLSGKNPPPLTIVASTFLYPFQRSRPPWASRILPSSSFIRYLRKCIEPSLLICWLNWYNQKPFIGLIGAGQMNDVGAVPTAAGETLEIFWMRSYHHNVGSHMKLPAGRARNPLTHIHVGDAKPVDVLRSSGNTVRYPLKENTIETSRIVMLGTGWRTRQAGPFTQPVTENSKFAAFACRIIHDRCAVGYELWCGPECVRNFLSVRYGQVFSRALCARCQRSEKTKYN